MNAPPFPANPSFGQYFGNWVWSGSRWVCTNSGIRVVTQTFLASAPYTPSPGLVSAVVECYGGGGGGGWAGPTPSAAWAIAGGGGGSGGYSRVTLAAALVRGGVNVTVAGAVAGSAAGQATSFGAMCVANGGLEGANNDFATGGGAGGAGAAVGVGDVVYPGMTGSNGSFEETPSTSTWFAIAGGIGGSIFGGATTVNVGPGIVTGSQNAIGNTGAGGGGGAVNQIVWASVPPGDLVNGHISGGQGAAGMCVVTEYCWADAMDDGCGCGPSGGARVEIGAPQGRAGWGGGFDND